MDRNDPDIVQLVERYDKWRRIYGYAGKVAPDVPGWESGRLWFRDGYPYPDWWAYVLEAISGPRYRVLRASTERSQTPVGSLKGSFSRIHVAGKFIIYNAAICLRSACRMEMIGPKWRSTGLDPRVDAQIESDRVVKYVLRSNPDTYFIMTRGDMRYSHILPLSYDELDAQLLEGFPESVTSRINSELR
jgi:hypothetical protein